MNKKNASIRVLVALACLFLVAQASNAWALQISPKGFSEPEGTIIQLNVTLSGSDWMLPNQALANQCASIGINGRYVARYLLKRIDQSATFSTSATKGDLHLAAQGKPGGDVTVLYCSPAIVAPNLTDTTTAVHLHVDTLEELTETAKLELYRLDLSGNRTLVTTVEIAIQDGSSNQNSNECSSTELAGESPSANASLATTDCDDSPRGAGFLADRFTFAGTQGQTIAIDAHWNDMDGYLYLESPSGSIVNENDDDTGTSDSRISRTLGQTGTYTIWATSKLVGVTGNYEISLTGGVSTPSCDGRELECGSALSGDLGGTSCTAGPQGAEFPAEKFTFTGDAGDTVWLRADWDFDGYLFLNGPEGQLIAENDNYSGAANSAIEHRLREDGTYTVWASTYEPEDSGSFEIALDCGPAAGPDLAVDAPDLDDTSLTPGQNIEISAVLRNVGDTAADSTALHYVISSDAYIDRSDPAVFSIPAPALDAEETVESSAELRAPGASGAYWIGACADVVAAEASVTNNCSDGTAINVATQTACSRKDLACGESLSGNLGVQDCSSSPRGAGYRAEVLDVEVEAGDSIVAGATWSGLDGYLLLEDPSGQVVASNDDDSDFLHSGIEYTAEHDGTHRIWVTSVQRGATGSYDVALECGSASAPDLKASTVSVVNSDVIVSQSLNVSASIHNQGGSESASTQVSLMLSADPEISPDDTVLTNQSLAAVPAGSNTSYTVVTEAPETAGNYWLGICVDAVAGETVTRNNCSPVGTPDSVIQVSGGSSACSVSSMGCEEVRSGTLGSADCDRGPRGRGYAADSYAFSGVAGERVSLEANWSGFDGYLYLEDPNGEIESENDDAGGRDDSRIDHVLKHSGIYRVWPSAHDQGSGGNYEFSLNCNVEAGPDLVVTMPQLDDTTVKPHQTLSLTAEVRNEGDEAAAATALQYFLVTGDSVSSTDRRLGRSDVGVLEAGASSTEEVSFAIDVVPGTYRLAACVDADALELNDADNCAFSEQVTVEENNRPIDIHAGMNDAWFDPTTGGQGFFINVFPDSKQVFVSWFTYDLERPGASAPYELGEPGHRWLTALGTYERGVATLDIYLNQGGLFDESQPVPIESLYGSMTLRFDDCNHGEIEFDIPSITEQGTIPITRVATDNLRACQEKTGELDNLAASASAVAQDAGNAVEAALHINPGLNDAWFNPATGGQGFSFNVFPRLGTVFLSWFTYDTESIASNVPSQIGHPGLRWLTALGAFEGDRAELTLYRVAGGEFNSGTPVPEETDYGTVSVRFDTCNSGELTYDIPSLSRSGVVPIRRLARDTIPACEQPEMHGDHDAFGVSPGNKYVLENFCGGTASWLFDWPDTLHASSYVVELWRNDALIPMTFEVNESEFRYEKETEIPAEHLAGWKWRYQARNLVSGETAAFSRFMTFDVGACN